MNKWAGTWSLKPSDVAEWLGLHINTVKRIPPEQLPFLRVTARGDRRYREEDVTAYIESRLEGVKR